MAAGGPDGEDGTSAPTAEASAAAAGLDSPLGLCSLVSQEAATAALGEAVGPGEPDRSSTFSDSYHCRYTATGSDSVLDLQVDPGESREDWEGHMSDVGLDDETALTGIGEAALRPDDAVLGPGTRLSAYVDGYSIWVVMYTAADPETVYAAAEQVARDLIAELPAYVAEPTEEPGP